MSSDPPGRERDARRVARRDMRQGGFLYADGHPNGRCPHPPGRIHTRVVDTEDHKRATHKICQDCDTITEYFVADDRYRLPLPTIEDAQRPTGKVTGMSLEAIIGRLTEIANDLPYEHAREINTKLTSAAEEVSSMVSRTSHQEVAAEMHALAQQLEEYNANCLNRAKMRIESIVERLASN